DHLTGEGTCRFAFDRFDHDPAFARARREDDYACPVVAPDSDTDVDWEWSDCPHFRSRSTERVCVRCGLEERRMAHDDSRPLLEEHHLSYAGATDGDAQPSHEITVYLCRWCHAKIHNSWGRITDDVSPDPEALAAKEERRSRELDETDFRTAADRYDRPNDTE
ncbi:MAG: hypothetical protein ABEJ48_07870, partial [Halobacteriales archaeon]